MLKIAKFVSLFLGTSRFRLLHIIFLTAFLYLSLPLPDVRSAQVTLAWDANTSPGIAGYKVYYGPSSGSYTSIIDVGNNTTYTVSNLQNGATYYFAVTVYDTSGDQSGYSNQVSNTASATCTYSISPASQSPGSSGGPGTVSVTVSSGCSWTAISNASWITVTSNGSVTGNGTVNYSVSANSGTTSRTGTMTIAGKTFTVTQSGSSQYTLTINKSGTGTGSVTNNPAGKTFNAGTVINLTATPDASSTFAGWSGGCTGISPTCSVTMKTNTSVTAKFNLKTGANGGGIGSGTASCTYPRQESQTGTNYYVSTHGVYSAAKYSATKTYTLVRLSLKLYRAAGSPTGTVQAKMWANNSGKPGTLLATSTNTRNIADITTNGGGADYDFDFTGVSISPGTFWYGIYMSNNSGTVYCIGSTTGGGSNSFWYGASGPPGSVLLDNAQPYFLAKSCN